eukprot:2082326-Amphidinium_carterae.4
MVTWRSLPPCGKLQMRKRGARDSLNLQNGPSCRLYSLKCEISSNADSRHHSRLLVVLGCPLAALQEHTK